MESTISKVITFLHDSSNLSVEIFTNGGCYKLFQILHEIEPSCEAWYDPIVGHVYTKYNNKFYDIRGELLEPLNLVKLEEYKVGIIEQAETWQHILVV